MLGYRDSPSPMSLVDRLHQLNDTLHSLALKLKDSIAGAVSNAVGQVIRDVMRKVLGVEDEPLSRPDPLERFDPDHDPRHDPWDDLDNETDSEEEWTPRQPPQQDRARGQRWKDALRAGVQTGLWWLRHQQGKRPILTTASLALITGSAAYLLGPTLAGCVSVIASISSLLVTADAAHSVFGWVGLIG